MKAFILFIGILITVSACRNDSDSPGNRGIMDWKLSRGNTALSGYTKIPLPKKPILLWSYKGETRTVSSPVVDNGTTYWCDKRGRILGVDITGKLCFEYKLETAVEATPMIHDSILFIGRIDGMMTAISLTSKDTIWNYETMGQISASANYTNFEGRKAIVFGSYDNFLYFVDLQNGIEMNRFESGYYLNGAVALHKKQVVFGGCDSWLRIIDSQTGVSTDSLLLDNYIPASPAIIDDYCYVGDYSGNIYELQLKEGIIISHKKIRESENENTSFVSVPAITPKTLYFLSDDRFLYSVDRKNGSVNWRHMLKGDIGESSPVVCNDKLVVCTKTGIITILNTDNGKSEWEYDTGEQIVSSPAVIKDHFMILTAKGTLLCFGKE